MKLRNCEIVQQLKYLNIKKVEEVLKEKCGQGKAIKDYAYIVHNKDVDENNKPKSDHIHIALRLNNPYEVKQIASWFSVKEQYVCRIKGRWSDMLKYLTHDNAEGKHQYADDEVVSNYDWQDVRDSGSSDSRKNDIITKIVEGEIREYNYFNYIDVVEYDKYKKSIDNAFKYRIDKIKGSDRVMECVFISGDSGSGKTTYAKEFAKEQGMSVYVSSGSNDVLDDYKGQDCIILDDLRPSTMGLSDLLKMLDNNTASSVKSRYKNKVLECKLIIITTILDIDTFFKNVFSEEKETSVQLKRRCKTKVRMDRDNMYMSFWLEKSKRYCNEIVSPNPMKVLYQQQDLTQDEILEMAKKMCLGSVDAINAIQMDNKGYHATDEKSPFNE